jgi:hypothetical protein
MKSSPVFFLSAASAGVICHIQDIHTQVPLYNSFKKQRFPVWQYFPYFPFFHYLPTSVKSCALISDPVSFLVMLSVKVSTRRKPKFFFHFFDMKNKRERVECGSDQCIGYDQCSMTSRQRLRGIGRGSSRIYGADGCRVARWHHHNF